MACNKKEMETETTDDRDGEGFTAVCWEDSQVRDPIKGRKQITVCLAFFLTIFLPFLFCLIIDFR